LIKSKEGRKADRKKFLKRGEGRKVEKDGSKDKTKKERNEKGKGEQKERKEVRITEDMKIGESHEGRNGER
jgi:hypothetical protein